MTNEKPTCISCDKDCDNVGKFHYACLDHPHARAYLMRDVIDEVNSTLKCNSKWEDLEPYYCGVNAMCKKILLLIDGVAK